MSTFSIPVSHTAPDLNYYSGNKFYYNPSPPPQPLPLPSSASSPSIPSSSSSTSSSLSSSTSPPPPLPLPPSSYLSDYDYLLKIVLIGDSGVGKSSILRRFADGSFPSHHLPTIGVDFEIRTHRIPAPSWDKTPSIAAIEQRGMNHNNNNKGIGDGFYGEKIVKLQIWDCAGQDRFHSIAASFYRGAHIVLIVFDLTDFNSLNNISRWIKEVESYTQFNSEIIIVGNKSDLRWKRTIDPEDVINILKLNHYENKVYMETSALENKNIEQLFLSAAKNFVEKHRPNNINDNNNNNNNNNNIKKSFALDSASFINNNTHNKKLPTEGGDNDNGLLSCCKIQ